MAKFFTVVVLTLGLSVCSGAKAAAMPPVLTSPPTLSPDMPQAGQITSFSATATDPQALPLIFTYDYGDGTVDMLGAHVYSSPGTFTVLVTASNRDASTTTSLFISIDGFAAPRVASRTCLPGTTNLWIKSQSIKVGVAGKESWHAKFIYNADRTSAGIFNPAIDAFVASLGTILPVQVNPSQLKRAGPQLVFQSAKGVKPSISVAINESAQTLSISANAETFTDIVPAVLHNFVKLGGSEFALDIALDKKGKFTANDGYRTAAFVVSKGNLTIKTPGKDSAHFSLLLGDPAFQFPGASTAKTVRFRIISSDGKTVIDKDFTSIVSFAKGKFKSGKDTATPAGKFSYDSAKGMMSASLSKATLTGLLNGTEEHIRVDVIIGDTTYSTYVTLFAPKKGSYSTSMAKGSTPASGVSRPTVTATTPVDGATRVAINQKVSATFSAAMDPSTITTGSFTLQQGSTFLTGTVTLVGATATFTSDENLASNTLFTATIKTTAKDSSGISLANDYVWCFTTGSTADTITPTVSSIIPANLATGVAVNTKISATFSEQMDPASLSTATFTLMQGTTAVSGTVTYSAVGAIATFAPSSNLASSTTYTATVTSGAKDLAGNTLASNFVWTFTTGASADTTPPTVISVIPANLATGVAINSKISATFSEAMDPLTLNTATFTLMQGTAAVSGTVTYAAVGATATFTPSSNLASGAAYTATVTTGAKDLAGNALANNFVWTFTTGASADTTPPNVISINPADKSTNVTINHTVNATFDKAMDPATINTVNFTLAGPNPITGTVSYDAVNKIATFTPSSDLAFNTLFTATITTGVKDLAGNALATTKVWSFTTGTQRTIVPPTLGAIAPFGTFGGGAGMTNQGLRTVVNGDIGTTGASTMVTGFHDTAGNIYTETPLNQGKVNGNINTAPPAPGNATTFAIATQGAKDAQTAYDNLSPAAIPGGMDPGAGQLGGLKLPPGVYKSAGATFQITGSDLTLDGQGDTNGVWVFQMAAGLTVGAPGAPRSINLINGAQAKNVYWYVGSSATINAAGGGTMVGTIIAPAGVTFSTAGNDLPTQVVTLNGRAIGLNASTTLVNTIINVPAP